MAKKREITIHPSSGSKKVITKKVITKRASKVLDESESQVSEGNSDDVIKSVRQKRVCPFCQSKTIPSYTDTAALSRYLSDRVKIMPKIKTGLCSKHQRAVTKQIKYARILSLLPFTPSV